MSNLYLLLRQRISIKHVYENTFDVSTQKAQSDVENICECILSCIMEYDDYCKLMEEEAQHNNELPKRIQREFSLKINQKLKDLQRSHDAKYKKR